MIDVTEYESMCDGCLSANNVVDIPTDFGHLCTKCFEKHFCLNCGYDYDEPEHQECIRAVKAGSGLLYCLLCFRPGGDHPECLLKEEREQVLQDFARERSA